MGGPFSTATSLILDVDAHRDNCPSRKGGGVHPCSFVWLGHSSVTVFERSENTPHHTTRALRHDSSAL